MTSGNWRATATVGGKFTPVRPIFTPDQKHLLVLTSLELRVYYVQTKQCIRSVPIEDSEQVVDLYTTDDKTVWVCRNDGRCSVIDWMEREYLQAVDLDVPLRKLLNVNMKKSTYMAVMEGKNKHGFAIVERNMDTGNLKHLAHCKTAKLYALSSNRQYYAFFSSSHKTGESSLVVGKCNSHEVKNFKRTHALSALAVSDDGTIAAGSATGVIDLYYHAMDPAQHTIRALKWHVDSVLSLQFSLDNAYLLSGGKERVLVFWQLETDHTQFLPRLDGEIKDIVVDATSEQYALRLGDDQVLVLSAVDLISRLQVSGIKAQFNKLPSDPERERRKRKKLGEVHGDTMERLGDYTSLFAVHPRSKCLYLPTQQSCQIQVYDTKKDDQEQTFSVGSTIPTGKVKEEALIEEAQLKHISFTKDGRWMCTVDENIAPTVDELLSKDDKSVELKFWHSDSKGKWQLATRVSSPHGYNKSVLDVIPQTTGHGFITAAEDGGVRLWRPSPATRDQSTISWSVRRILAPGGTTSTAVAVAVSPDNSTMLVGFETSIYLVNNSNYQTLGPLPNFLGGRVRALHFVNVQTVVALSKTRLVVWDLVNNHANWSVAVASPQCGKRLLAVDASEQQQRFALGVNHYDLEYRTVGKVFVFNPDSPLPVHVHQHSGAIAGVASVPGTRNFAFMDVHGRVVTLSDTGAADRKTAKDHNKSSIQEIANLYQLKREAQRKLREQEQEQQDLPQGQAQVLNINSFDAVFDGQTEYSLDSLTNLFDKVMGVVSK